jgi:hypothetical protein
LSSIKGVIEQRRAEFVTLDQGFVSQPKLAANLGSSLFGPKHDYLDVRSQPRPTSERIPLGHVNVTFKGFGNGEKG